LSPWPERCSLHPYPLKEANSSYSQHFDFLPAREKCETNGRNETMGRRHLMAERCATAARSIQSWTLRMRAYGAKSSDGHDILMVTKIIEGVVARKRELTWNTRKKFPGDAVHDRHINKSALRTQCRWKSKLRPGDCRAWLRRPPLRLHLPHQDFIAKMFVFPCGPSSIQLRHDGRRSDGENGRDFRKP